ncbi:MAG: glycoside hydrolase family 97 N-terminal domain-containing protein, partial [Acidobacteria bacterium]|nr:glycoside hydrolase family 97 N-terminal domain-containing protein [Acidobacteriota bacterium]
MSLRVLFALLLSLPVAAAEIAAVASPDGAVRFVLAANSKGDLEYTVTFQGKPVIETSGIGITVDRVNLAQGAETGKIDRYQTKETYPWHGVHSTATDHSNGARVALTHLKSRASYTLEIRAYNDGIAFRHVAPGSGARVPDEATVFRLPDGSTLWYHNLEDHYEAQHMRKSLRAVPPGAWLAPPVTFMLPKGAGFASITEGALRNYSGLAFQGDGNGGLHARLGHAVPASYPFRLRYAQDVERLTRPAAIDGTIATPWRVVLIGADLNALVNADVVHNVAAPPDPKLFPEGLKTEWVKPGRSLWSYLDGGNNTLEGMKEFSRLAKELSFEYNLLEGFWSRWPERDLKELADYSRGLGVRIIIWKHSNALRDAKSIRDFFDMCSRTGVAGAKIDFFDHEHKDVVGLYETLSRAAAEHKLVLDFHGSNKPTGQERTWPNVIGMEGIRGMEMGAPYAQHEVTLPFTRMLAGLADYTPT